jgi:hypothetical protein
MFCAPGRPEDRNLNGFCLTFYRIRGRGLQKECLLDTFRREILRLPGFPLGPVYACTRVSGANTCCKFSTTVIVYLRFQTVGAKA